MAHGVLRDIAILQIGNPFVRVVALAPSGIRTWDERPIRLDGQAGLEGEHRVLQVVLTFDRHAPIHQEYRYGARACRQPRQVLGTPDRSDGGNDLEAEALRDRRNELVRPGASDMHSDGLFALVPIPFDVRARTNFAQRVVAPTRG